MQLYRRSFSRSVQVIRGGTTMQLYHRSFSRSVQVFCGGPTGDFGFLERLGQFLPLGRQVTILDAGANIGGASVLFSQLIGGYGEVCISCVHSDRALLAVDKPCSVLFSQLVGGYGEVRSPAMHCSLPSAATARCAPHVYTVNVDRDRALLTHDELHVPPTGG